MNDLLREIADYIAKEQASINEWRQIHADDWHVMAEASVKEACLADLIYFYERLKYLT